MRLYEEKFPSLMFVTTFHLNSTQQPLMDCVDHQVDFKTSKDGSESLSKVLSRTYPQSIFAIRTLYIQEIVSRYQRSSDDRKKNRKNDRRRKIGPFKIRPRLYHTLILIFVLTLCDHDGSNPIADDVGDSSRLTHEFVDAK